MFIFSECDSFYKAEISCISDLIETKTKMMEAKYLSEIELIKAKCLSEAKITELIESKIDLAKLGSDRGIYPRGELPLGSDKLIDCPIDKPSFRIVDGTCLR